MLWEDIEKKYGKELADKMKKSKWLDHITVVIRKDGKLDIPKEDINRAYKDITGKLIHPSEWD